MALKVADLGHTASTERVHLQWTKRLEAEFYAQGDQERERGMQVSPLMDRHQQGSQAGISKSQVGALLMQSAYDGSGHTMLPEVIRHTDVGKVVDCHQQA